MTETYRTYRISGARRAPALTWLISGLSAAGCRIITSPDPKVAPFKVVFETSEGERMGAIFYLFTITTVPTRNRPTDEWRFQIKYGSKDGQLHDIWQDPTGLYTTIFVGIDPKTGCWVAADPVLHSPTLLFISLEFKQHHMDAIQQEGWHVWERESIKKKEEPVEVLVGGRPERVLDLVRLERAAKGLDQGNRQLLAEQLNDALRAPVVGPVPKPPPTSKGQLHDLAREFEMQPEDILNLINNAPRLKMAVRGWVAEDHLRRVLAGVPGVTDCERLNLEGRPDISLKYRGHGPLYIECKNVLRQVTADGRPRVDFQRTRASKGDPCSRYYRADEFDVLAACLHAVSGEWGFTYRLPREMDSHKKCAGRLSQTVRVDERWEDAETVLASAAGAST